MKTSKTGQTVSIPIFPMLEDGAEKLAKKAGDESARVMFSLNRRKMYLENPDGITWRVKKILAVGAWVSAVDE